MTRDAAHLAVEDAFGITASDPGRHVRTMRSVGMSGRMQERFHGGAVLRDRLAHVIEVSSTEAIYDISTTVNDDFSVANSAPARTSVASVYFLKTSNVTLDSPLEK